jgi:hypothetical protein
MKRQLATYKLLQVVQTDPATAHSRLIRVSNLKVRREYYKAINVVLQRTQPIRVDIDKKGIMDNRI